ncbi:hypothetical protein DPMN_107296 [Dreissena polymorpha]|uniref:Uncharacterized protein n=1 Tax=Dreissena polymorpha TaxID=45954 RepID=A0A9D4K6H1_DREPO|nr:hypothetical protein DPMN_107296 [Dreissena polymorpha]
MKERLQQGGIALELLANVPLPEQRGMRSERDLPKRVRTWNVRTRMSVCSTQAAKNEYGYPWWRQWFPYLVTFTYIEFHVGADYAAYMSHYRVSVATLANYSDIALWSNEDLCYETQGDHPPFPSSDTHAVLGVFCKEPVVGNTIRIQLLRPRTQLVLCDVYVSQGSVPDDLKTARVVPLFKKNDKTEREREKETETERQRERQREREREGGREGFNEGERGRDRWREGGRVREGGRERGRGRERERKGGREGEREGRREGGKEGGREGGREGRKEGEREEGGGRQGKRERGREGGRTQMSNI